MPQRDHLRLRLNFEACTLALNHFALTPSLRAALELAPIDEATRGMRVMFSQVECTRQEACDLLVQFQRPPQSFNAHNRDLCFEAVSTIIEALARFRE